MKLSFSRQKNNALTAYDVMVLIVCILIAAVILFQILIIPPHSGRQRINCVSNLRQIDIAFRIWEGDNGNQFPMSVSVTNGGAMELVDAGNLTTCLKCASNEMCAPNLFVCPNDPDRTVTTNWNDLNRSHVSYFISPDANEDHPATILDGDDNLIVGGMPVVSGLVNLSSNVPVSWARTRHRFCGNIGLADGTVIQTTSNSLQWALRQTGLATNRIVIP